MHAAAKRRRVRHPRNVGVEFRDFKGGLGFTVWGLGFRVWDLGFTVWGLGFRVWDLGFGI